MDIQSTAKWPESLQDKLFAYDWFSVFITGVDTGLAPKI